MNRCKYKLIQGIIWNLLFFLPFESILQERGKIPKVHLQETVEELKKFNSRRKLKVIQDTRQLYEGGKLDSLDTNHDNECDIMDMIANCAS